MKKIETKKAPKALGPYSQGIASDNFCFVSMELGIDPATGKLAAEDAVRQAHQAIKNVENILDSAGFKLSDVVKATLYITDLNDFTSINEVYGQYFTNKPARSLVVQSAMPIDAKVALDVIAYKIEDTTEEQDYYTR